MPLRALKILVVVMGIILVGGFATLVVLIANRVANRQAATPPPVSTFAAAPIELPTGAHVEAMALGPDRLAVTLAFPDGNREILIIDPGSGRRVGTIPLHTAR